MNLQSPTRLPFPLLMVAALSAGPVARAQGLAPTALAGSLLTVKISSGQAPFATNGAYRLFVTVAGTNYLVLGRAGPLASGIISYATAGLDVGRATLADSQSGPGTSLTLTFASPAAGTLALTNSSGFQIGAFTLTAYAGREPPQLFLPGLAGGQFECCLSGQPGYAYTVETSTDSVSWQPWRNVPLTDLTTNFGDAVGAVCFYRAQLASSAFAPADLTNRTLNLTINEGAPPLATNGICQWLADTNGAGYQIVGGPGIPNSSGSYVYSRTGPDGGVISLQDSHAGATSQQLVFASPQSGYFYATNAAGYEAGTFRLADGPVEFLGQVKFAPDTAHAGSVAIAADGSPTSLSVTNVSRWIWTLKLPADALLAPRTITMTPVTNLDVSGALLPLSAGVQFSPGGLRFSDGVTLTVTPPAPLGTHATLVLANDDGSEMYLAPSTNQGGSYSTTLLHFSSAAATDPSDQQWEDFQNSHLPQAQAAYQNAVRQCQSLERVVTVPPEPPDYDWKCESSGDDAAIDAYQKALFAKEDEALRQLLSAAKTLELLGETVSPNEFSVARELIETAKYRKVDALFGQYSGDAKKFMAVTRIALGVMREDQLLGGSGRADWYQEIQNWGQRVEDWAFDQLRNEHKYSKAVALPGIVKSLAILGVSVDTNEFLDRLAKALRFTLSLDLNFVFKGWGTDGNLEDQVSEEAQGDIDLQAGTAPPFPGNTNTVKIVSGAWADILDDCAYSLHAGQSSTFRVFLGLQPCEQPPQVVFVLNGPYPPSETWTGCDNVSMPNPWLGVVYGGAFICKTEVGHGAGGLFYFPLSDGQEEIVDENVSGDSTTTPCADPQQRASGTIQIHIRHTPQ